MLLLLGNRGQLPIKWKINGACPWFSLMYRHSASDLLWFTQLAGMGTGPLTILSDSLETPWRITRLLYGQSTLR